MLPSIGYAIWPIGNECNETMLVSTCPHARRHTRLHRCVHACMHMSVSRVDLLPSSVESTLSTSYLGMDVCADMCRHMFRHVFRRVPRHQRCSYLCVDVPKRHASREMPIRVFEQVRRHLLSLCLYLVMAYVVMAYSARICASACVKTSS